MTRVRVDSGGALSGALLRDGLVHEVSLLVQPLVAGGAERAFDWGAGAESRATSPQAEQPGHKGAQPRTTFSLVDVRALDGGVVWLRYET